MARDPIEQLLERMERPVEPRADFGDTLFRRLMRELEEAEALQSSRPNWRRFLPRFALAAGGLALVVAIAVVASVLFLASSSNSALAIIEKAQRDFAEVPPFRATVSMWVSADLLREENPAYTGPDAHAVRVVSYAGPDRWRQDFIRQDPADFIAGRGAGSFWVWDGQQLGEYNADDNTFNVTPTAASFDPLGYLSWDNPTRSPPSDAQPIPATRSPTDDSGGYWKQRCADSEVLPDTQIAGRAARHLRCGDTEVWIDIEAGLILKIVSPQFADEIIEISYDHAFPADTFEVTPPPGAEEIPQEVKSGPYDVVDLVPGETAPPWEGSLLDGGTLDLQDLRGQAVLVFFWADWCDDACFSSFAPFQQAFDGWADRVAFVSVDFAGDPEEAATRLQTGGYTFPVVNDASGAIGATWGVEGVPVWVVLDAEGKVVDVLLKSKTLAELEDLLRTISD